MADLAISVNRKNNNYSYIIELVYLFADIDIQTKDLVMDK